MVHVSSGPGHCAVCGPEACRAVMPSAVSQRLSGGGSLESWPSCGHSTGHGMPAPAQAAACPALTARCSRRPPPHSLARVPPLCGEAALLRCPRGAAPPPTLFFRRVRGLLRVTRAHGGWAGSGRVRTVSLTGVRRGAARGRTPRPRGQGRQPVLVCRQRQGSLGRSAGRPCCPLFFQDRGGDGSPAAGHGISPAAHGLSCGADSPGRGWIRPSWARPSERPLGRVATEGAAAAGRHA